jgi:multidrug efflux system membrane fusion protein
VQRGPAGTFSYVIGKDDTVTAKAITVTQQNETEAVIASGIAPTDQVVTTGFANLSEGAKVTIGKDEQAPTADLAPRKRQGKRGNRQGGEKAEHRGKNGDGGKKQQTGGAQGNEQSGGNAKAQP